MRGNVGKADDSEAPIKINIENIDNETFEKNFLWIACFIIYY